MNRPLTPQEKISLEAELAKGLIEHVREVAKVDEQDGDLILDTIEGETNLVEAVNEGAVEIALLDAEIDSLKALEGVIKARRARKEHKKEQLRTAIRWAIEAIGEKKFRCPVATMSITPTKPKLGELDEALIPSKYFTPETKLILDKKTLLADGLLLKPETDDAPAERIPGVEVIPAGTTITIRF